MEGEGAGNSMCVLDLNQGFARHPVMEGCNVEPPTMIHSFTECPHHVVAHAIHGFHQVALAGFDEVVMDTIDALIALLIASTAKDMHLVASTLKASTKLRSDNSQAPN
jgi:hypothetical protein